MTETFREVIDAAEKAVVDEAAHDLGTLTRLVDSLDLTLPGTDGERAYLAVLLDWLGMRDHATRILQWVDSGNAQVNGTEDATLRNLEGMLAVNHGQYGRAVQLFEEALTVAPESTLVRTKILANLAAASLRAGRMIRAAAWATEASEANLQAGDPAVDVLLTSVNACMAVIKDDVARLRVVASALGDASRSRLAQLGTDHPRAIMTIANLAAVEFKLAYAEDSFERQERALGVLEVTSRRLAADLGIDHPQALVSMANLCMADWVLARADGSVQKLKAAVAALESVSRRLDSILGVNHPQALLIAAKVASAKLEIAQKFGVWLAPHEITRAIQEKTRQPKAVNEEKSIDVQRFMPLSDGSAETAIGHSAVAVVTKPVRHLAVTAFRTYATLSWEWPSDVQLAELSWELDGNKNRVTLAKAEYRSAGGVQIPLGRGPCTVEVRTVTKVGRASFKAPPVRALIDKVVDVAISYKIHNTGGLGRLDSRSKKVIFQTDEDPAEVQVRIVAVPGRIIPTSANAGIVLLETTLALKPGVPVEYRVTVPRSVTRPYWVRCFIVDGSGRLVDPPIPDLKVA